MLGYRFWIGKQPDSCHLHGGHAESSRVAINEKRIGKTAYRGVCICLGIFKLVVLGNMCPHAVA